MKQHAGGDCSVNHRLHEAAADGLVFSPHGTSYTSPPFHNPRLLAPRVLTQQQSVGVGVEIPKHNHMWAYTLLTFSEVA